MSNHPWNRCDVCGRLIAFEDFYSGKAVRELVTPDSHFSEETYKTLCPAHAMEMKDAEL